MSSSSVTLRRKIKTLTNQLNKNLQETRLLREEYDKTLEELTELKRHQKLNTEADNKIKKLEKTVSVNVQYIKKKKDEHEAQIKKMELTIKTLSSKLNNSDFLEKRLNKLNERQSNNLMSRRTQRNFNRPSTVTSSVNRLI